MATQYLHSAQPSTVSEKIADRRYLYSPLVDFLCLGGSSLILLPLLLLVPATDYRAELAVAMLLVAHLINHPHFAHSYQIFYRGFRTKAFTPSLGPLLRTRYILSGIIVPVVLLSFFALCIVGGNVRLLGYSANVMALLVGWHYVKQGYGMLMVDAALKRQPFTKAEKRILLVNSYAVWVAAWCAFNALVSKEALWGLEYYTLAVPGLAVKASAAIALATSAAATATLLFRWRSTGALPVNGVIAYYVSLYLWLLFVTFNPLWLLVVPALHSLQYLAVVWRFQTNYEAAQLAEPKYRADSLACRVFGGGLAVHVAMFLLSGILIGFLGFWGLPTLLGTYVSYDQQIFGGTLFLFAAWVFINVHHYFLDNVMWRRENPDTKRYLFT